MLKAIDQPQTEWHSTLDAFEATYKHEQKVTSLINELVNLAIQEKDNATNNFLQWFVKEQVEEEKSADDMVGKLKLTKDSPHAMDMLDKEMSQRIFNPPTENE